MYPYSPQKLLINKKMGLRFKIIYNFRENWINIHKNFGGTQLVPDSRCKVKDLVVPQTNIEISLQFDLKCFQWRIII